MPNSPPEAVGGARPLRVLNVIRSVDPAQGGLAEGLRQAVRAAAELGQADEVLTLDAPGAPWLAGFPAPVHALGPVATNYGHTPALLPWLKERAPRYDAVVVHGLWQYPGLAVWRALRGGTVPYFVFCHGMLDPWFKRQYPLKHLKKWLYWPWAEYRVLRDAQAVLFTTEQEARLAPQSFALYRARAAVVGYGMALDDASRAADAQRFLAAYPHTRGQRLLLFMARLHPKKGCDLLIEAFARVAAADARLHLVMAGPDQVGWQAELQARAQRLGLAGRISWCGMLSGDLKWSAYRAAEAFVLPSHQENFGVAVAEALAMGLPVLISDQVNIWREIAAAEAGLVAPDTLAGTTALLQNWLALDAGQRQAMGQRASGCYAQHFQMAAAARRLCAVIAGPASNRPGAESRVPDPIHGPETSAR